jgi:hypothetical protein
LAEKQRFLVKKAQPIILLAVLKGTVNETGLKSASVEGKNRTSTTI